MSSVIMMRAFAEAHARFEQVHKRAQARLNCWEACFSLEKEDRCIRIAQRAYLLRFKKLVKGHVEL